MKLCDGDCTIKKRNRQRCLILKPFPGSKCQDARAYFKPSEGNLLPVCSLVSISKVQPTDSQSVRILHRLILKHLNTLFASITRTSENEVIHGITCGNYTTGAYLTF